MDDEMLRFGLVGVLVNTTQYHSIAVSQYGVGSSIGDT